MTLKLDDFEPVGYVIPRSIDWNEVYDTIGLSKIKTDARTLPLYTASQLQQLLDQCSAKDAEVEKLNRGVEDIGRELLKEQELNSTLLLERKQLATLQAQNAELLADAERLDFMDTNVKFKMGWEVGTAPVGNVSITSVILGKNTIREAIDAAIAKAKEG